MPCRLPARDRFFSKTEPEPNSGCLLWIAGVDREGYGQFWLRPRQHRAHRVAWAFAFGKIPEGMLVCHHCDTPSCVNVGHLFLGTHADNVRDREAKGRSADRHGEANGRAKLTEADVRVIRKDPRLQRVIARGYGVDKSVIGQIKRGVIWKCVA